MTAPEIWRRSKQRVPWEVVGKKCSFCGEIRVGNSPICNKCQKAETEKKLGRLRHEKLTKK